ncbi:MAG: acetyl-CoA carboxylase biotin carboxyl carrier protein subunit [Bdellovibrionales bacterium]
MYFEAESEGIKYQVSVTESKSHWKVGTRQDEKDWIYYDIRKEDYRLLDDTVSFIFKDSSYLVDVIAKGTEYTVYTRGVFKTFKVYNEEALLHESLKAGGGMGAGNELTSGMPGKIVKIFVKPGDELQVGDPILIMEAMKMENEMRAASPVKIKEILVKEGENVETGATLVTYAKET